MRIVVSTPTFLPIVGGAEMGIHEIYQRIAQEHDVTVLTPAPHPRHIHQQRGVLSERPAYRVHHVRPGPEAQPAPRLGRAVRMTSLPYIRELRKMHRESPIDVANFHFVRPHGLAMLYAQSRLGVPTVLSLVGRSDVIGELGPPRRTAARRVVRKAGRVVQNSSFYLQGEPTESDAIVIPYGVSTADYNPDRASLELRLRHGIPAHAKVLLTVQRLDAVKRIDELLHVLAALRQRNTAREFRLIVGGSGPELSSLQSLAHRLGIHEVVHFLGYVSESELPVWYASADAFVFHSMFETFGIVLAQAMAAGLPIVAANTSCVAEVVGDRGVVVEPFDTARFADAVVGVVDTVEHTRLSIRARKHAVDSLDWNIIAARYVELLKGATMSAEG